MQEHAREEPWLDNGRLGARLSVPPCGAHHHSGKERGSLPWRIYGRAGLLFAGFAQDFGVVFSLITGKNLLQQGR